MSLTVSTSVPSALEVYTTMRYINRLLHYILHYSPHDLPGVRLYDGDLQVLMTLLRNMDGKLLEFGSTLAAITRNVRDLQQQVSRRTSLSSRRRQSDVTSTTTLARDV